MSQILATVSITVRRGNPQSRSKRESVREPARKLLLVRDRNLAKNDPGSNFPGTQQLSAGSLLEALAQLELRTIDIVVLGAEFREEERVLFLLEAQRRGFSGPILHVVSGTTQVLKETPLSAAHTPNHALESGKFTEREQAVLQRVAGGWTNLQIATDLKCSEGSVKAILQQLFTKFGVRKRSQIVRIAFEQGLPAAQLPSTPSPRA